MGGGIWVESAAGGRQHVPLHRAASTSTTLPGDGAAPSRRWPSLPVLIVDDNDVNRRILHEQLTRWGMKPTAVEQRPGGARRAWPRRRGGTTRSRSCCSTRNMPDMDGFDVAERMAARPELAGATIMMLTSSGQYGDAGALPRARDRGLPDQADQAGRPARRDLRACSRPRARACRRQSPATVDARLRVPAASILLAEDNVVNQRVAVGLLTQARAHASTVANNGREALAALERERVRPRADGRADAGDGRPRGDRARSASASASGGRAHPDRRDDRARHERRSRALPRRRHGRLPVEADRPGRCSSTWSSSTMAGARCRSRSRSTRAELMERLGGDKELSREVDPVVPRRRPAATGGDRGCRGRAARRVDPDDIACARGRGGDLSARAVVEAAQVLERLGAEGRLDAADAAFPRWQGRPPAFWKLSDRPRVSSVGDAPHARADRRRRRRLRPRCSRCTRAALGARGRHARDGTEALASLSSDAFAVAGDCRLDDAGRRRPRAVPADPQTPAHALCTSCC